MRRPLLAAVLCAAILPAAAQDATFHVDPVTENQGETLGFRLKLESHFAIPILRDGVRLERWRLSIHQTKYALRVDGRIAAIGSTRMLAPYLREISDPTLAFGYLRFVRTFSVPLPLDAETAYSQLLDFGSESYSGNYSKADAVRWRVSENPEVVCEANRYVIRQAAIVWRVTDFAADPERWPWRHFAGEPLGRIILIEETVTRSGEYSARTVRVLQDSRDVNRYVRRSPY